MTNEELNAVIMRAEDNYERLKDLGHEQYEEIQRLKEENEILKQTMFDESMLINENAFLKERIENTLEFINDTNLPKVFKNEVAIRLKGEDK